MSGLDAPIERMDRVAELYGEITAATRTFLAALAEVDRHRDWEGAHFGSCAEWLAWRLGIKRNAAAERVRAARALESLPLTAQAMARGEISFSKVRALTRVATPDTEATLLEFARTGSAQNLERVVRSWRHLDDAKELSRERINHRSRRLSIAPDGEGMYVVRGRLDPEVGALLMRALEAASDALYKAEWADRDVSEPRQRRADAIGLLAERALAIGFEGTEAGPRSERYQVVVHVDERLEGERSELEDGTRVTAVTARRLACDCTRSEATRSRGQIVGASRRTRSVPPRLRRALVARDCGCRFPGCGLRFTEAHHIVHWADGGATKLENLVLLCRSHHRRVHEDGWRVVSDRTGETIVFFAPDGRAMAAAPPMPALGPDPTRVLVERNRARGVHPDPDALRPRHLRDPDIPWEIEARVWDALDPPATAPEAAA